MKNRTVQAGLKKWESDNIFFQPVHLLPGFEYEKLLAAISYYTKNIEAGKHMREDILGNHEESIERQLILDGFMVKPVHRCLLTLSAIRQMFLQNIAE